MSTPQRHPCGCRSGPRPGSSAPPRGYEKPVRVEIVPARSAGEVDAFRRLCRDYAASLPCITVSLTHQGFDREMDGLPGKYAPPAGEILLAVLRRPDGSQDPIGGGALRPLDEAGVCEMKRMYVRPECRGIGAGMALARALVEVARGRGYSLMKLDTDRTFDAAIAIYRKLGFRECPPYNTDPCNDTLWFDLPLRP
ncbi:MAG: GNAT family N-acetyltransferase [Phycisphaerae bacterium]|nr:GNAT family N-acetyltransferase [Phycisphaerae bacterium]